MTSTIDQVLKLIDAGFTKDEILSLTQSGSTSNETPAEGTDSQAQGDATDPKEDDAAAPATDSKDDTKEALNALTSQVQMLIKAQQASNRAGLGSAGSKPQTTDEILAGLINPQN